MRAKFRGKSYTIHREWKSALVDGITTDPEVAPRTIHIAANLTDQARLDTEIHEALHACLWDLSEEAVAETAESIAGFLWRVGYRVPE